MRLRLILFRSLRLVCPACGQGRLFSGWFSMHPNCSHCGLAYRREAGYFLGSIYFNYGLTALVLTISFFGLFLGAGISPEKLLWPLAAFAVLFPLWFFRYARSLWLGFDQYIDPQGAVYSHPQQAAAPGDSNLPSEHQPAEEHP